MSIRRSWGKDRMFGASRLSADPISLTVFEVIVDCFQMRDRVFNKLRGGPSVIEAGLALRNDDKGILGLESVLGPPALPATYPTVLRDSSRPCP